MSPKSPTAAALRRAGRRAAVHLVQALIEGLKALEAVIDEMAGAREGDQDRTRVRRHKIEVE